MTRAVEVWIDADIAPLARVGTLHEDRGQIRFHYDRSWLARSEAIAIDPVLTLDDAPYFPNPETGNFGIFLDSAPDRWGQTLMQRREALEAREANRRPRTLHAWDYLLGVQDAARQGALRFRDPETARFLADDALAAPPVTSLRELESVARELSGRRIDDLHRLQQWLAVLLAPGASLGGARPKANFTDTDGSTWIAKFPAREDDRDVGSWEYLAHQLAKRAGIEVPDARRAKFSDFHTFCVQRFDRVTGQRRFYASAMTMLGKERSEGTSYIELAQFLRLRGDPAFVESDQAQLFRRVVFYVAIGNRDDHLRNHGFLLMRNGWRLAPAFDVNPSIDKAEHVLNLDETSPQPDIKAVLSTHEYYGLDGASARKILDEVRAAVAGWRDEARRLQIAAAEINLISAAFLS
ncbi:MAG: type II toxin-antitoxin system HipA family toxin [Steroidobacteraceae bacterium]